MTTSDGSISRIANVGIHLPFSAPRSGWPIQMMLCSASVGLLIYVLSSLSPEAQRAVALDSPLFELLPAIIVFSVACYTWVRFASTTYAYWLAACLAFLCYAGFSICHVALDIAAPSQGAIKLTSEWLAPVARITLAGFLIIAGMTERRLQSARSPKACLKVFMAWAVGTAVAVTGLYELASYAYPFLAAGSERAILLAQIAPHTLAAIACVIATAFIATAALRDGDASAKLACLWLIPITVSCGVRAVYYLSLEPGLLWQARAIDVIAAALGAVALNVHCALDNAKASEQLHDLRSMHDISWSLAAAANLSAMLSAFVRVLTETGGAKLAALYLLEESGKELRLESAVGEGSDSLAVGTRYSLEPQGRSGFHSGHTARAVQEQASQVLEDVFSDVEFTTWRFVAQNSGWVVSVPLITRKSVIGVFNAYFVQHEPISRDRLHILETMAALVAPAIESRRNDILISHQLQTEAA